MAAPIRFDPRRVAPRAIGGAAVLALAVSLVPAAAAAAKEYLLTATRPNNLVLVDPAARKVERVYPVPGPGMYHAILPSPDGKVVYLLTNRWESVSGIDLDSGKEVFRADFDLPGFRVKGFMGVTLSRDGRELFVYQLPIKLESDRLLVQDTRIVVYRTDGGVGAKPVRQFPAPRRITQLATSADGKKLYAMGWDVYVMDPATGAIVETHGLRGWDRPGLRFADGMAIFPASEQADVVASFYAGLREDRKPDDPEALVVGVWTLDLKDGTFRMTDLDRAPDVGFTTVVNPVRRNEAYMSGKTLKRFDLAGGKVLKEIDLDHEYWMVNVSGDGREVYVGGNMNDVTVYASDTLERLGVIRMPGGADQTFATMRLFHR